MGGNNSQKSAYNQARAQQNWEMQQYQQMYGPNGTFSNATTPITKAGNELLTGTNPAIQMNENAANEAINQGQIASTRQAASADASLYSGLSDALSRARIRQGGYSPGFDASQADIARQTAEAENQATIAPAEQAALQRQNQANQNITTELGAKQLGGNLSLAPLNEQLQALGLTSNQIANLIGIQGNIASGEKNGPQYILDYLQHGADSVAKAMGGA